MLDHLLVPHCKLDEKCAEVHALVLGGGLVIVRVDFMNAISVIVIVGDIVLIVVGPVVMFGATVSQSLHAVIVVV